MKITCTGIRQIYREQWAVGHGSELTYPGDHILRFNLSIVPGITEFRRKNNAYHETRKAVDHKTLDSRERLRTTCIFMRPCQIRVQIFLKTKIMPFRRCKQPGHTVFICKLYAIQSRRVIRSIFMGVSLCVKSTDTINIHSATSRIRNK